MNRSKKLLSLIAVLSLATLFTISLGGQAKADKSTGVFCTMDIVVETLNNTGTVIGSEVYSKQFALNDGERFSDDFSTRTRFKFFDASMTRLNGESTISVDWFADVTVFNSVDFTSSVVLSNGQKVGKTVGTHTFYTSNSSTRTSFSLVCAEQ